MRDQHQTPDASDVRHARAQHRLAGLPPLCIGVIEREDSAVPAALVCSILDHLFLRRHVGELWIVREVFHRDEVTAWSKSAEIEIQYCSRYVLLAVAHKFDGVVALGVEDWLVRRLRDGGKIVWEPLKPNDAPRARSLTLRGGR